MIPVAKVKLIVDTYKTLEKELASSDIDKKDFVKKSKEYSSIGEIINAAKGYIGFEKEKKELEKIINEKNGDKEMTKLAENELTQMLKQKEEYEKKLKTADPVVNVVSQSCPLFVPLVEEGWLDGTIAEDIAKIYLKPITSANIDTLVLGCTHYPLLKPLLQSQIGNEIKIIDSAYPVANKIDKLITSTEIQTEKNSKGDLSCFTTDILSQFESIAERFLDSPVTTVSTATLE